MLTIRISRRVAFLVVLGVFLAIPAGSWASHRFTDVPDSNIFHADISWLADAGVTLGCNPPTNDEFCPSDAVTREQMAAFMKRLAQYLDAEDGTPGQADNADTVDGQHASAFALKTDLPTVETVLQLGQHSTPSMSYVDVPGTSLTAVTPANGRLLVTFSSEVLCLDNAPGGPTPWCLVQVLVDGTEIQPDRVIFAAGDPDGNAWNSRSHQFVSDPLAGGQHTVQARYRVDDTGAVFNLDQTILSVLPLTP